MTDVVTRAGGTCVHHRRKPALSKCVTCGAALCGECIVRTPVGFKCASCTQSRVDATATPGGWRRRRATPDGRDDEPQDGGLWRRRAVNAGVALTVLALLAGASYALTRPTTASVPSAQASAPPVGPTDVQVQFTGSGGPTIGGVLSLPTKSSQPAPGVLIIPDFGAIDHDGIATPGLVPDPLYADLARTMAARGIASLRYDPRGQGQSVLPPGSAIQLPDLVGDASAGLRFLAGRTEIDARRLTILGDGWGGLVALQLAAQDHSLTGVVLVSTPGRPVVDTIASQLLAAASTPDEGQRQVQQLRSTVAGLLGGAHLPGPSQLDTALRPILQPSQEAFLRSIFALAPADLAKQVHLPSLIVRGARDPAITAADTDALSAAMGAQSRVMVAMTSGHTLSIVSAAAAGPTTVPTPNAGMQNIHLGDSLTVARDNASMLAVAGWISTTTPSGTTTTMPPGDGHFGH